MNWLYALLFFLFLFLANERSPIWGEGIVRIKFWIRRIFPNIPTPIHSELKSKLFIFVRILSTTWDAQFQFSYSAHSSTSGFFSNQLYIHIWSPFVVHYFMFSFFIFSCFHFSFSRAHSFFHCPLVVSAFAPDRVKEHHLQGEAEEYHL